VILYIQMSLCEETLEEWMSKRTNQIPQPLFLTISRQILSGVDYIHSKRIVHHDIKVKRNLELAQLVDSSSTQHNNEIYLFDSLAIYSFHRRANMKYNWEILV